MYSVRKTRSLSICLILVLSAVGPLATADHDSHVAMNSSLFIDGDEFEMEQIPFWGELISCTEYPDEGYECEEDNDGDGQPDGSWWFHHCDDSSGEWICSLAEVNPLVEEGNHSLVFEVYDLEADTNFSVHTHVHTWTYGQDWNMAWNGFIDSSSAGELNSSDIYLIVENSTCGGYAHIEVSYAENGTNWSEGESLGSNAFYFDSPCDGDSHLNLEYDGVQWEEIPHEYMGDEIIDCDEYGVQWFCTMDYNDDGEADDLRYFEDCDNSTGDWECVEHYSTPPIEEGTHTMVIEASGLESNESYVLGVGTSVCGHWDCYGEEWESVPFNASTESETFYMETDNYTCFTVVHAWVHLVQWDNSSGDYWAYDEVERRDFHFNGPCEMPPSPFTLSMDGVVHEEIIHYEEYDNCEEEEFESGWFRCWQDDWDEDSDGEPEHWDHGEWCEEDASTGTWFCELWRENPFMPAGNHSMQLDIEDLDPGYSYMLTVQVNHHMWFEHESDYEELFFNATGSSWTETGFFEATNQTCHVNFGFGLHTVNWSNDSNYGHNGTVYLGTMGYNGPCDEPPSPFTLTYDGVEWEEEWHYEEYGNCELEGSGTDFRCWQDDWDYDGDGEPEEWNYHEECEEDPSTGTWLCQAWWNAPSIDAGNHTMELTIEDLEVGTSYSVFIGIEECTQEFCENDWMEFDFEATAETMSETFYLETDNYTCHASIGIDLFEVGSGNETWSDHIFGDWLEFQGPCEEPPSRIKLYADGVEWDWVSFWDEYDYCVQEDGHFICWHDDWDQDGDGEPEHWDWREECDNSTGDWQCLAWLETPPIEEGNHTMELTIDDLEVGSNYSVNIHLEVCQNMAGCDWDFLQFEFEATAETMSETFYLETDNYTCDVQIHVDLYDLEWGHHYGEYFGYKGPCEEPPSPFTLTYDGVEWEEEVHYSQFDYCEEEGDYFRCWMEHWDYDGDGEPDDWVHYEECEEDPAGSWWCAVSWSPPSFDAGNHMMELTIGYLEVGKTYNVSVGYGVWWAGWGYYEEHVEEFQFEATSENMSETFYLETDNYTCYVGMGIDLFEVEGEGNQSWFDHIFGEGFNWYAPCEQPPSPFTLSADGVEHDLVTHWDEYDYCEEEDDYFRCWNDGWEEYDEWDWRDDCEELSDGSWQCVAWYGEPPIEEGNHTMELTIEDLEVGTNYSVEMEILVCQNMAGCDWDYLEFEFEATAETMSETFYLETDNYTCEVQIHVDLYDLEWGDRIFSDNFRYNGPCEKPPSPFTLSADGVEHESVIHWNEYDNCDADPGNEDMRCWNDEWDYDGDGEPDDWDWRFHEECEELSDGAWQCVAWMEDPLIGEGNHTMEITIEYLEVGTSYSVEMEKWVCYSMEGCDDDWMVFEFEATAETMSETFYLETDNYTCDVGVRLHLYEMVENDDGETWGNRIYEEHFGYKGPCEMPPSPLTLTYDGVEYSSGNMVLEFDNCEQWYDEWMCWQEDWDFDGDGHPDYQQDMMECEEDTSTGTWFCESYWSLRPELDEGDHVMELTIEDLEVGNNYTYQISWEQCTRNDCDGDGLSSEEFEATSGTTSETFDLETSVQTCNVYMFVSLYEWFEEDGNTWADHIWGQYFDFSGPCEEGDRVIELEYDDGSGAMEWDMLDVEIWYDECWPYGSDNWICLEDQQIQSENDCEEDESTGDWFCTSETTPEAAPGTYDMTWVIGDLEDGSDYMVEWEMCYSSIMGYDCDAEMSSEFTGTSSGTHDIGDWEMVIENTTCSVDMYIQLAYTYDHDGDGEADDVDWIHGFWAGFTGPCLYEWPIEIGLEVDDNGWQEVEGIDMNEMMEMFGDEEPSDEEVLAWVMSNIGYELSEGNWSMMWTMEGLEGGETYHLSLYGEAENGGSESFYCGNGEEIYFGSVNDGEEDCVDGADEQQYDDNGDPINWFDCSDGSEIWIYQVNDGVYDCPMGDDELVGWELEEETSFESDETNSIDWSLEVPGFCIAFIEADLYDDDWRQVGMFTAYLLGDLASQDDNGDSVPDCLEALVDEDGDSSGEIGWELEDFYVGQDFGLELVDVDTDNGTAVVFVAQHSTLDDDFRMKVDYDFFNGDGVLNETEAAQFDENLRAGLGGDSGGCEDEAPPFALNGVDYWCAVTNVRIENLANNTAGLSAVIIWGWDMHYNASEDDAGQITLSFPGDSSGTFEFNGTMCGGASPESGYVPVTWSYDNTTVASLCVDVTAGDNFAAIEVVFGHPDSDGDGYNDFDDRFPDDPEEWEDSDDDGVGDNSDDFPDDANETSDVDGDGVGDNSDAFPWDPTESADSDGDGWGDNSDAFPNDSTEWVDTDEDGIGDNADTDADGDGTSDSDEDSDGDGVNDDEDDFPFDANETTDSDGDGVGDNGDDFPNDANETTDTDGDGIGDNSDEDADGDGTPNDLDDFPLSGTESTDTDGDGVGDNSDAFPNDMSEWLDTDGDGTGNNADTDDDGDGTPDDSDAFPLDDAEDTDTDMDGVGDNADEFDNDAGEWVDTDGDGVGDNSDDFPANPNEIRDSDGDGTGDNSDAFPADPSEIVDSDGDGVGNNADAFPYDDSEQKDTDGDGVGDNADDDADGDGVPDEPVTPEPDEDGGGILPGFSAATGLVSMLGAAILMSGRRKD